LKHLALLFALLLVGCATTKTNTEDTLPHFDATAPIERALHATVLIQTRQGETFCSGTIVQGTGLILSAGHCFADGREFQLTGVHGTYLADIASVDPDNDILFLRPRIRISKRDGVPLAAEPGKMGETVYALGHAGGDAYPFTLTSGIISFPHRTDPHHYVQATAPLMGGMSGGGFYNARGELLGANLFVWLDAVHCLFDCPGVFQDSPLYGFSYLPLVKDALARAK
jgi:S1-C subfamily serine protease